MVYGNSLKYGKSRVSRDVVMRIKIMLKSVM